MPKLKPTQSVSLMCLRDATRCALLSVPLGGSPQSEEYSTSSAMNIKNLAEELVELWKFLQIFILCLACAIVAITTKLKCLKKKAYFSHMLILFI